MNLKSLSTRLIIAYVGLILVGFGAIALVVGRQISDSVHQSFEQQMVSEAQLVAEGMDGVLAGLYNGDITEDDLNAAIADYEERLDATITVTQFDTVPEPNDGSRDGHDNNPPVRVDETEAPEIVAARRGSSLVAERTINGTRSLVTAASIDSRMGPLGILQLSKPSRQLQRELYGQWLLLGVAILLIAVVAIMMSIYVAYSLSRPLKTLQQSALQLSHGNLAHRAPPFVTTELAEVGHAFNDMATKLEAMFEEQRAFASNTSHELRTPLTTMRLRTEALRYDTQLDADTRQQYVTELDDELIRMSHMIEDLILLSRFDAGRATVGTEQIDLAAFARSLSATLAPTLAQKGLTLTLDIPDNPLPPIAASLNHLTITCRNLLENAIKYTPDGGRITWQLEAAEQAVICRIGDTGQGIDPDQLPHVFDRFYRADKSRSRSIPGTGLGLSLVKAIVGFYGGTIAVESDGSGQGTTVTMRWPCQ